MTDKAPQGCPRGSGTSLKRLERVDAELQPGVKLLEVKVEKKEDESRTMNQGR